MAIELGHSAWAAGTPGPASGPIGRLRVGLVVWDFPVLSETFVAELADGLSAQGCDLRVLAVNPQGSCAPRSNAPAPFGVARSADQRPFGIGEAFGLGRARMRKAHRLVPLGLIDALALRRSHRLRVARLMAREAPFDIVHCQFAPLGLLALRHLRIGTIAARKLVVHLRGYDISALVAEKGPALYGELFRKADIFFANCHHFRQKAIALGCPPDKVIVIGSPIDTARFQPPMRVGPRRSETLSLVGVGRLVEKKGFADAIDALRLLRDKGIDARLRLVGDGPLRAALVQQAARLDLANHVRFDGAQPQAGVIAALAESDIALAPSVRAANGDEDAAVNTLKEAMAMGLPVVATRHGGIPELVRDPEHGRLVDERSPDGLAAAIADLATDPDGWAAMGRAGRATVVKEFDKRTVISRTLAAYHSVLKEEHRP